MSDSASNMAVLGYFILLYVIIGPIMAAMVMDKRLVIAVIANSSDTGRYEDVVDTLDRWNTTIDGIEVTFIDTANSSTFMFMYSGCQPDSQDLVVYVDTQSRGTTLSRIAQISGYPYFTLSPREDPQTMHPKVHMGVTLSDIKGVVSAVFAEANRSMALLCDSTCAGWMEFPMEISTSSAYIEIHIPDNETALADTLITLGQMSDIQDFIFIGNAENVQELLSPENHEYGLHKEFHRWIMFVIDGTVPTIANPPDNVIIVTERDIATNISQQSETSTISTHLVDTLDLISLIWEQMNISEAEQGVSMRGGQCLSPSVKQQFTDISQQVSFEGDTGTVMMVDGGQKRNIHFKLYRAATANAMLQQVGSWDSKGLHLSDDLYPEYRSITKFRVCTVIEAPFIFRNDTDGETVYTGYAIDVLEEIASAMNFEYEIWEPETGTYGTYSDNGTWDGCVLELQRGAADMIVTSLAVTADREAVIDFTYPYYDFAGIQIMMRRTDNESHLFMFATVFDTYVWISLFAVLGATGVLLVIFDRLVPRQNQRYPGAGILGSLKETMWFAIGGITQTGGGITPTDIGGRFLVAGFWFFCSIMMATFTANLAAFLTVSRLSVSVSDLDDLVSQSDINYTVVEGSPVMTYFKRMADIENDFYSIWKDLSFSDVHDLAVWDYPLGEKYSKMWKSIQRSGMVENTAEGVSKVLNDNVAFIHESPSVEYETSLNCQLLQIGNQFSSKPYAFALRQNSPFTREMSNIILSLQKDLQLTRLKDKWWNSKKLSCPSLHSNDGLDIYTIRGDFIVIAGGVLIGLIVLGVELIWYRRKLRLRTEEPE